MMSHENIIAILSILISAIVTLAGFIIARQTEKLMTMREQLSEKKYKAYADAVKMFYSVLKDAKANRTTNNREIKLSPQTSDFSPCFRHPTSSIKHLLTAQVIS